MKTVLIVDDDPQLRTVFNSALSRSGYRVIEADSGAAGLQMARQHLPDLIISDIHMPGGDGSTLLRDVRHDPELRSKQVVLMTGRPDLVTPRSGMEDGADDFLVKPVSLKALISCVEARLSRASISWRVEDERVAQLRSLVPSQLPHEFFTPLAGIIGLMDILRADFPNLPVAEVQDIHNDVYQSALRLQRTLRNYLQLLDLQTASSAPVPALSFSEARESIQMGVNEALRMNKREADISIEVKDCAISIRTGDLSHVVEELVDNACKFSRHGTMIRIVLDTDGRLFILDAGRGMGPEAISRIGAFQQFDRKKHEQQGLGLGMVLVQKITALYGATFVVNSQPGEGTQIEIAFPAESHSAGTSEPAGDNEPKTVPTVEALVH